MTQVMQEKQVLFVTEAKGQVFSFSIEEDMLPEHLECATVFDSGDLESKFSGDECVRLRQICSGLLPDERCQKIEFVYIARVLNEHRTNFKLVHVTDQPSLSVRGRVDAVLRSHGFEPLFG